MTDSLVDSLQNLQLTSTNLSRSRRRGRRRNNRNASEESDRTFDTLSNSTTSFDSASTSSFISNSSDETISVARSVTLSFLSQTSDTFSRSTLSRKLEFYHSLLIIFGVHVVPPSITKCVAILRGIHVNIKEFLGFINGNRNLNTVTRYPSRNALVKDLVETGAYVKLKTAKKEMLSPVLVTVYYRG